MTPQHSYPPGLRFLTQERCPLGGRQCSATQIHSEFFTRRIVPSLIRLVGDLFGKEAERETHIGDTKHVNKHINQHGRLTGWFVPCTK